MHGVTLAFIFQTIYFKNCLVTAENAGRNM